MKIAHPCTENYNAMQPVTGGKHCVSCNKTVTDFTKYTDEELIAFFNKRENAEACGRYKAGQVENNNVLNNFFYAAKNLSSLNPIKILAILCLPFMMFLSSCMGARKPMPKDNNTQTEIDTVSAIPKEVVK